MGKGEAVRRGPVKTFSQRSRVFSPGIATMASFSLPTIHDSPDGGWGPSTSVLPENFKFKDIPYAPYSKTDKLGRFADWNDIAGDNRPGANNANNANANNNANNNNNQRTGGRNRRDGAQAFGAGGPSAFAFQVEDESSFSLVDNKTNQPRRGGGFARGRGIGRGGTAYNNRQPQRNQRGGFTNTRGGGNQRGGPKRGWRDWEKVQYIIHDL